MSIGTANGSVLDRVTGGKKKRKRTTTEAYARLPTAIGRKRRVKNVAVRADDVGHDFPQGKRESAPGAFLLSDRRGDKRDGPDIVRRLTKFDAGGRKKEKKKKGG